MRLSGRSLTGQRECLSLTNLHPVPVGELALLVRGLVMELPEQALKLGLRV